MRIVMLAQFYPPIIGGEERHVRNLSVALAARGHNVSVITLWHPGMPSLEVDQGVRIYRIRASMQRVGALFSEQGRQHSPPFTDPEVLLAIRRILQSERPHIVHAHNWLLHSFLPLKMWSSAKLVVTLHDYSMVCASKRLMYQSRPCSGPEAQKCLRCASDHYGMAKGATTMLMNMLSSKVERKLVDMFLPVSKAVAQGTQLEHYRVPYRIVPNFIADTLAVNTEHPLLEQLPAEQFLLFVGDLVRDKGVEILFQAYTMLEHRIPLVVIGRPTIDSPLSIPQGVLTLHNWSHEAVLAAWSRCTIAVVPSIWPDPCPTVAMEAMAMERPLIASRIGGLSDIVSHGESGLLVPPGDKQALQGALDSLLIDPLQRAALGARARQRVSSFQAQTVVPAIEQVYQEVLGIKDVYTKAIHVNALS